MLDRIVTTAILFTVSALPAMAQATCQPGQCTSLPEPATMTLFGLGIGGAYLARRLIGRK